MRIVEETRNCLAQNNESGQLESQKCLFVIREKGSPPFHCYCHSKKEISSTTIDKASINHQKSDTDEELREFTSEYYIPSALHPVVPAASASIADFPVGKVGVYTRKIRCAKAVEGRCSSGSDDRWFSGTSHSITSGHCEEMDLFSVVHLSKPKLVRGVRPLRDGEEPCWWAKVTARRTMELVLEQPEVESTDVLAPTPLRSVPGATVEPPGPDATSVGSSEDADVAEVDSGLKRKRATSDDGAGPSKRVRHVSLGLSTSTEEETLDAPPTLTAKEVTETPPPNVEATSDSSAPVTHAVQSPPQTNPLTADDISRRGRETGPKAFEGMPVDQLMEEFDMVTGRSRCGGADAQLSRVVAVLCTEPADGKNGMLVKDEQERAKMSFDQRRGEAVGKAGGEVRNSVLEYDEELILTCCPPLLSAEVRQSFGDIVKCALARGKVEAVEELHEKKLLTVPAAQLERDQDYPIDVIMAGLTLARHATEGAEVQPDYFLKPDVAQLQVPIFASPRDILNPFALEKEIPLKESLEAHAIRLAKKKGVKGKAILCGVGAAHIPRSDGVPVSVATVSPKDSELLGKLEEAGDAAYQVGSSERSRCHSI
ncbi:hypothetical protein Tco_0500107 [Tanacetum coccineum]